MTTPRKLEAVTPGPVRAGMDVTPEIRLVRPLREGGMGAVWVASHARLGREVAVKFLLGERAADPEARSRFKREAETASRVKSPHVVDILDFGVLGDEAPFLVMELLDGIDLGHRLDDAERMPHAELVTIITQLCRALEAVHEAGIVHRDIKPENVFLSRVHGEPFVRLLDFGVAKARPVGELSLATSRSTRAGQSLGTPYYMSPEQFKNRRDLDGRSDLWAVGVLVYEALTGTLPFLADSVGALAIVVNDAVAVRPSFFVPSLPREVDAWFSRACSREPSARFQTPRELSSALAEALRAGAQPVARPAPSVSPSRPRAVRAETAQDVTPSSAAGESKGTVALAARNFVHERFGAAGWSKVTAALPPADRAAFDGLTAIGWLPSTAIGAALGAIDSTLAPPGTSLMHDYGRFAAEHDLTVFHRIFLRMANPAFVLEKSAEYWRRFHSRGVWEVHRLPSGATAALSDFYIGTAYCAALHAYIGRLFELVGAKDVSVQHSECVSRGATACTFRMQYR